MARVLMRLGAAVGAVLAVLLTASPMARSIAVRLAALRFGRAFGQGVAVTTAIDRGEWTRVVLRADLSEALSQVAKRPLKAAAFSHFGGFGSKPYSSWLDPLSPYYQAWLGAYLVVADEGPPFGFDDDGKPVADTARQLLEADQRLVLSAVGLIPKEDSRPRVVLLGEPATEQTVSWASTWVRQRGSGETHAAFQRGGGFARRRARWLYGVVPGDAEAPVSDFHTVTMHASLWYRYDATLGATVAKFYVYSEYVNQHGELVSLGSTIKEECEALLDGIRFDPK